MGMTGHVAIAFEPANESIAIAAVVGGESIEEKWWSFNPDFGLVREDYQELNSVLNWLSNQKPEWQSLKNVIFGARLIRSPGFGVGEGIFLYDPHDIAMMATAMGQVENGTLTLGIETASSKWFFLRHEQQYKEAIRDRFCQIRHELTKVQASGCSMIGFIF